MHFQNSCTQNCGHHSLLIITGNTHKESCLKLLLILIPVREKGLYILKLIVATKWWSFSQLKKKTIGVTNKEIYLVRVVFIYV